MTGENDTNYQVKFELITNDNSNTNLIKLVTLKNIFSKQLPKMPREYISRLVLDRNHRSLVLLKDDVVIGGICYRSFIEQHFGEIAFCAVEGSEQVKGYGTRMMCHLKQSVKNNGIEYFLTYADNFAIGYFKKQGFTTTVYLDPKKWKGYIKDYDGGTLMCCRLCARLDYLTLKDLVIKQRDFIAEQIRTRVSDIEYDGINGKKFPDLYSIPGVKEAGWIPGTL